MPTRDIAGKTVQVNDEGFLTNPAEWNKDIAAVIAAEEGVPELTAAHWKVIDPVLVDQVHAPEGEEDGDVDAVA